jgi:CBS domain containing-hemolysin-like protein/mannitol/fructose-specific phosphotransferase system IIA component (Ntr-type)
MSTLVLLLLVFLLLLLNAFFVLAEFAAVKIRPTQVEAIASRGDRRAKALRHIVQHIEEYLPVCQIGITFTSVGLGFVGEPAFADLLEPILGSAAAAHSVAITVSYILVSFLHILIGELVPKQIAIRTTERTGLLVARPMRFFRALFYPPLVLLNRSANLILRIMRIPPVSPDFMPSEEEMRIILARSQKQGMISFRRLLLLENVFDFGEIRVRAAMTPIQKVALLSIDRPWEENRGVLLSTHFSRYPVLDGKGRPVGILHVKDLIHREPNWPNEVDLRKLVRPCSVTRQDEWLETLLNNLQLRRTHMSLVENAKGTIIGIITMEDILEKIVGVIEDEFETEPSTRLADFVNGPRIILDLNAQSAADAIEEILSRVPASELPAPKEAIRTAVLARENAMSTYLGKGLAVPHARLARLKAPCLFLGLSREGVQFEGAPGRAHALFLLLTSAQAPRDQLRLLSRIAMLRESDYVWDRLIAGASPEEVLEAIRGGEAFAAR